MQAIEFETDYKNGLIRIPENYHINPDSHIRVIVLIQDENKSDSVEFLKTLKEKYNRIQEDDINIQQIYKNRDEMDDRNAMFD
jgi:hypothetical protein